MRSVNGTIFGSAGWKVRSLLIAGCMAFSFSGSVEGATSLYLAYGVDTREDSPNHNQITLSDLHGDHYHSYSVNDGDPGTHIPSPFVVAPGEGNIVTLSMGSMNVSPSSVDVYQIPESPATDFRLTLLSWSGPSTNLMNVDFLHDGHTHGMSPGGDEELHIDEATDIYFAFSEGAGLGRYQVDFEIADESGNYSSRQFSVLVDAIPEPSSTLLILLSGAVMTLRRRRS